MATFWLGSLSWVPAMEVKDSFAPIHMAPEARTVLDWRARHQAWAERVLLKPMRQRTESKPWQEEGMRWAGRAVQDLIPSSDNPVPPVLLRVGARLEAAGCDDPLFVYLLARLRGKDRTNAFAVAEKYEAALAQTRSWHGPQALAWLIQLDLSDAKGMSSTIDEPRARALVEQTRVVMNDGSFRGEEDQLFYRFFTGGSAQQLHLWSRLFLPLAENAPLGPWLQKMLGACLEMDLAVGDEANGLGNGDEKRMESFRERMPRLRQLFQEAWELRPDRADAAARLISMNEEGTMAEARRWFDRATAVEFDAEEAYLRIIDRCRPSRGGSAALLLACGGACAETRRYETIVPRFFILTLREAALAAPDWRQVMRRPELAAKQIAVSRAIADEPTRAQARRQSLEFLAVNAFLSGDLALAAKTRRAVPGELSLNARKKLEEFGIRDFDQQLAALSSPAGKALLRAEAARTAGQPEEARRALEAAKRASAPGDRGRLSPALARAQFLAAFETGQWVDSPIDESNPAWQGAPWATEDNFRGAPAQIRKMGVPTVFHAFPVGESFELRAEVPTVVAPTGTVLARVFVAGRPRAEGPPYPVPADFMGVDLRAWEKGQIAAQATGFPGQIISPRVLVQGRPVNTIVLRLRDGQFEMEVNGVSIAEGIPYDNIFGNQQELVFGYNKPPKAAAGPRKVEVRKLKADEAAKKVVAL